MLFLHLFLLLTASSVSVRHGLGFKILGFRGGNWGLISCELWRRLVCFWLPTLATAGLHSLMLFLVTNAGNCRTARPYAVSGYQRWQLPDCPALCCFWLPTLATAGLHSLMLLMVTNAGNCRTARPYAVSGYQRWQLADYPSLCPAGHQTNLHEHHSSVKLTQACDSREFWRVINNVPDHSDVCSASKMLTANHGIGSVFLIT